MGKSLSEIDRMAAWEFNQWWIYHCAFPFGDERDDWRMGTIASAVLADKMKKPPKPSDFMLQAPETQAQKDARLKAAMRKAAKPKGGAR